MALGLFWAADASAQPARPASDGLGDAWSGLVAQLVQTGLALALVCGLAWVAVRWLAPRLSGGGVRRAADARMTVVERLAIGPERELLIVRVDRERLLLASTPSGVALLRALDPCGDDVGLDDAGPDPTEPPALNADASPTPTAPDAR